MLTYVQNFKKYAVVLKIAENEKLFFLNEADRFMKRCLWFSSISYF